MDHSQHTQKINGVEEKLVPLANGSFGREWDGDPDLQRTSAIQAFPARSGSATKAEQTRDCLPFRCFGEVSVTSASVESCCLRPTGREAGSSRKKELGEFSPGYVRIVGGD